MAFSDKHITTNFIIFIFFAYLKDKDYYFYLEKLEGFVVQVYIIKLKLLKINVCGIHSFFIPPKLF